jgi:diketogulonate reductase-like aldo/keto reductase
MLTKPFGWTGAPVPLIGQGTWMLEGSRAGEHRAIEALRLGLDLGMTHIDTAEMYGNGRVEELVGQAIAGRREQVFLVSKVLPSNASYKGTLRACKQSLKRLGTDWLDLYLLHWPSSYPIEETMRAMAELADGGAVRHIGVSNFDVNGLRGAERALRKYRLACNQVLYHVGGRSIERRLLPYCAQSGLAVVGYSPFGHRAFPSPSSAGGRVLAEIAARHDRTPRQVVLNFLTRHKQVFTIPKAANPEHLRENAGAVGWELDAGDLAEIEGTFPAPGHDVPLGML